MRERDRHACPKPDIAPIEQARNSAVASRGDRGPCPAPDPYRAGPTPVRNPGSRGDAPGRRAYCLELAPWAHGRAPRAPCPTDSPGPSAEAVRRRRSRGPPTGHGRRLRRERPGAAPCPGPPPRLSPAEGLVGSARAADAWGLAYQLSVEQAAPRPPAHTRNGPPPRPTAPAVLATAALAAANRCALAEQKRPLHLLERCAHLTAGSRPPAPRSPNWMRGHGGAHAACTASQPHQPALARRLRGSASAVRSRLGDFVAQPQRSALAW